MHLIRHNAKMQTVIGNRMKKTSKILLYIISTILLTGCMAIIGIKETKPVNQMEIIQYAENFDIPIADCYVIDTSFISYLFSFDTTLFQNQIKNHYQPLQALYYDSTGQLVSFLVNCYAGGFPNLKWNRNEVLQSFPPKQQAPVDSILSLTQHLKYINRLSQSADLKTNGYDYFVVVYWNKFMWRQTKRFIHYIQNNCQLAIDKKVKIIYVNNDNLFGDVHSRAKNNIGSSIIAENVFIEVYLYTDNGVNKASGMPQIKRESNLWPYKRRFDFLLLNTPAIHQPNNFKMRNNIFSLYPDTSKMKRMYMDKLISDEKLTDYFEEVAAAIVDSNYRITKTYTVDELIEVASKFFYCDKVNADTTVQSHVCIAFNGLSEVIWEKDYILLSAFCFEAIFNDFDKDSSQIHEAYSSEKKLACQKYRSNITSLDNYLRDVKLELFNRMKNNTTLKESLLQYYELNKSNLAFAIVH